MFKNCRFCVFLNHHRGFIFTVLRLASTLILLFMILIWLNKCLNDGKPTILHKCLYRMLYSIKKNLSLIWEKVFSKLAHHHTIQSICSSRNNKNEKKKSQIIWRQLQTNKGLLTPCLYSPAEGTNRPIRKQMCVMIKKFFFGLKAETFQTCAAWISAATSPPSVRFWSLHICLSLSVFTARLQPDGSCEISAPHLRETMWPSSEGRLRSLLDDRFR